MINLTVNNDIRVDIDDNGLGILDLVVSYNVHDITIQIQDDELYSVLEYIKHSHDIARVHDNRSKRFRVFIKLMKDRYSNKRKTVDNSINDTMYGNNENKHLTMYEDDSSYYTNIMTDKEKQESHDEQADKLIAMFEDYDS